MIFLAETTVVQAGKFGIVGILNTIIDFAIFNVLTSKPFNMSKIKANVISATFAMTFSFFANREAVFHAGSGDAPTQALKFFAVTAFGLYVIQNAVLWVLLRHYKWPRRWVEASLKRTGLNKRLSTDFVLKNGAKVAATLCSLTWNFFFYKYVVYTV